MAIIKHFRNLEGKSELDFLKKIMKEDVLTLKSLLIRKVIKIAGRVLKTLILNDNLLHICKKNIQDVMNCNKDVE